jgi:hypothetical protein
MSRVFKLSSGIMRNYGHCPHHVYSVSKGKPDCLLHKGCIHAYGCYASNFMKINVDFLTRRAL